MAGKGVESHKTKRRKNIAAKKMQTAERDFLSLGLGFLFRYEPETFYLSNGTRYTPDFYCEETETFIEIIGTKQAFNKNRGKYELFQREYFPLLFVMMKDGEAKRPRILRKWSAPRPEKKKKPWITAAAARRQLGITPTQFWWRVKKSKIDFQRDAKTNRPMLFPADVAIIESVEIRDYFLRD